VIVKIDPNLLDIICCPVTRQPLEPMPASRLARLNASIEERNIKDRARNPVIARLEQALVTEDGKLAYPVEDGIPVLLEERGIALSQIDGA